MSTSTISCGNFACTSFILRMRIFFVIFNLPFLQYRFFCVNPKTQKKSIAPQVITYPFYNALMFILCLDRKYQTANYRKQHCKYRYNGISERICFQASCNGKAGKIRTNPKSTVIYMSAAQRTG